MNKVFIDVREPSEFQKDHVKGAFNITPEQLMSGAQEMSMLTKDTPIIVYCRTGSRSLVAKHILHSYGFTNVTNGINKDHIVSKLNL